MRLLVIGMLLFVLVGCGSDEPIMLTSTPAPAADSDGWITPDFTLTGLDGRIYSLSGLRGQWVIVNFWATWCAPCVEEMPVLQALADLYPGELVVLGINMREARADLSAFVSAHTIRYPILLDPDDAVLLDYQVMALPQTLVIDPAGVIVWRQFGPLDPQTFGTTLADLQRTSD